MAKCGSLTSNQDQHLVTGGNTDTFAPYGSWLPTMGLDLVRGVYTIRALLGTFRYQLAYQTAVARKDNPDAWATLDSLRTTTG